MDISHNFKGRGIGKEYYHKVSGKKQQTNFFSIQLNDSVYHRTKTRSSVLHTEIESERFQVTKDISTSKSRGSLFVVK